MTDFVYRFVSRVAAAQHTRPLPFLIAVVLATAGAGWLASHLRFDSSYEALLPADAPQVRHADAVRARTGGTRQLVIALSGGTTEARARFADSLVAPLRKLAGVRTVHASLPVDFFRTRALWLLDTQRLDALTDALKKAIHASKVQANPLGLHLDEEAEQKEVETAWKRVEDVLKEGRTTDLPQTPYLHSKDGRYTFVLLFPSIKFSDMEQARSLLSRVKATVAHRHPERAGIAVRYAGALAVLDEQHQVMRKDMTIASILAALLAVALVALFTRTAMAPVLVFLSLLPGIVWTFAFAYAWVGHVNIITGFLAAVLVGLGIDFTIHLLVRFKQERAGANARDALIAAAAGTAAPALMSALTTAGVFFTFATAQFRGFSEFGIIAGMGVLLTLLSTYLTLPALLRLTARLIPPARTKAFTRDGSIARPVAWTAVALFACGAALGVWGLPRLDFKNDFRQLRGESPATEFFDYVNENLSAGFNPAVALVASLEDARRVRRAALALAAHPSPTASVRVGKVLGADQLVPWNVDEKRPRIAALRDLVWDRVLDKVAREKSDQGERLRLARAMTRSAPWTFADLPTPFQERFRTVDPAHPEYLVYIWPSRIHDADYLAAQWEDALQRLSSRLDRAGIRHDIADETLILAWVYRLVRADALPLLLWALAVVFALLWLDVRSLRHSALLFTPLAVGMLVFVGVCYAAGITINMFNMVVFPSVIGIGIDNTIHLWHRYRHGGQGALRRVAWQTGTAAFLASATTAVGFGSTIIAHNAGLRSMGATAMIGIALTFGAAIVFFPSLLAILEPRTK